MAAPTHQWCKVTNSCFFFFFLVESVTNKVALKTLEYSLIMNNMSLLNFDSLSCWVVIVLPSLEYDYIRPLILTGLHSLFRHTAREEEMKWENVKPQEKTTLEDQFLTIALKTVKAWDQNKSVHNNILQPSLGHNLLSERECLYNASLNSSERACWNPDTLFPLRKIKLRQLD